MEYVKTQESSKSQEEPQKIMEAFDRLQKVSVILKEMGFRVIDRLITLDALKSPTSEAGFPIVRDGRDGIRALYTKRKGLVILFTNGFEDPANQKRQEVTQRLNKEGLL
mgnify:FL=1